MKVTKFDDISIGQKAEVTHVITEGDIQTFGDLSGDYNPLHFDDEWAKTTLFKGRIAHGILTASFISTAIGMQLPGPGTIYLKQEMEFKRPVRIGDTITAKIEVVEKDADTQHIKIRTTCINQNERTVLEGHALVTLMRMED
ncbi:MAG: MaoC family dehydratase [Candidatus Thorarchaeota archaeon]|nr:MaoC family dehydratase [Candidatus Thorarchaeota archaeon]